MLKKTLSILVILLVGFLSLGINASVQAATTFDDVYYDHWAYDWIERLYHAGVTSGCKTSPLRYCPEQNVNRAEMAKFLLKGVHGSSYIAPPVGNTTGFFDVSTTHWAATWIKQLATEGITSGCGGGNYCPEKKVTRAEMAKFLLTAKHYAGYTPPNMGTNTGFYDVPISYWAAAWIKQLFKEGITSGCGDGNYCPNDYVTRAEMAKFLVITFDLPELPSVPMATVYVQNNTGGELCYEVYDTGIGQQCYVAGEHFYGIFPSGTYDYRAEARCGNINDSNYYDGEVAHEFWCETVP